MHQWAMPLKWGTNPHDHDLYAILADTAAQQRDLAGIRQYAPLAEELAVRDDHKFYRAIANRALAVAHRLAGEYDDAGTRLDNAQELFQPLGTRWQIGRTLFEHGELEDARGNRADAHDYFARALVAFDALRAEPAAANVRARIQNLSS